MAGGLYTSCSLKLISKQSIKETVFVFLRKQITEVKRNRKIFLIQEVRKVKNKVRTMLSFVMWYHSTTAQMQNPTLLSYGFLFLLVFSSNNEKMLC